MRPSNYIPQGGQNPAMLLSQFQQFKKDYYAQNGANANPKDALMQYVQQNGVDPNMMNQATNLGKQLGFIK